MLEFRLAALYMLGGDWCRPDFEPPLSLQDGPLGAVVADEVRMEDIAHVPQFYIDGGCLVRRGVYKKMVHIYIYIYIYIGVWHRI